jgi:hypothetical protein
MPWIAKRTDSACLRITRVQCRVPILNESSSSLASNRVLPDWYQFAYLMKKSSSLTIIGLLALSLGFASQAQAQMKVGTIDMQKVFTAYYKTHDAEDKLKEAQKAYKDELDQRMDAYKKNLDVINKLNEEMNKPD